MEKIPKLPSLVLNVSRKYDTTLTISLMCQLGDVTLLICGIGLPQLFDLFFYLEQEKFTVTNLKTENLRCFKIQGSLRADLLLWGRIPHPLPLLLASQGTGAWEPEGSVLQPGGDGWEKCK